MGKEITLTIDGQTIKAPEGTLIVDAAKKIGIDIPVFCYHPKMEPVGMCRMCLVEIGRPVIDRATKQPVLEADGSPKIGFGPKLETACTTPISEGMVVLGLSDKVKAARHDIIEFLLTSHPLDCPVCDKGGECPLQNQTMEYGAGESRFRFAEKQHLDKHIPLGDLIWLDRERCIQCARCVRFQEELAGDPVIGFYHRGRMMEIQTHSEPGFDSIFSGNTTDICPVGALTTADFRFGARPWEMKPAASICLHCPVGCNLTFDVRREARSDGQVVIKRVMPRQNEAVNEIWICDKGRFGYHYTESKERLTQPLIRQGDRLIPATWEEAQAKAAAGWIAAGKDVVVLGSGRLSNEDLFALTRFSAKPLLYTNMAGGDLTAPFGVSAGTDLGKLGKGSVILVVASDLHEEAPLWWLRVKSAARRGVTVITLNPRTTRLDRYANYVLRYPYGEAATAVNWLMKSLSVDPSDYTLAAKAITDAENLIVFFGSEGLGLSGSAAVASACAGLLQSTGHVGRANNGLIGVWQRANDQGAWDQGYRPAVSLANSLASARAAYIAGADPIGDDPAMEDALKSANFVIVQELFLTKTAQIADVVFPAQAYTEREGTYTSGERRVQRTFPVVGPLPGTRADFEITAQLFHLIREGEARVHPVAQVFTAVAANTKGYEGLSYQKLSETTEQWPVVGGRDLYFGGTGYENRQGLGVQLPVVPVEPESAGAEDIVEPFPQGDLTAVPVTRLYDRGTTLVPAEVLGGRLPLPYVVLGKETAGRFELADGDQALLKLNDSSYSVEIRVEEDLAAGIAWVPRSMGIPVVEPVAVQIRKA
jgi:NADH-quinone oxidoreductase subunit G